MTGMRQLLRTLCDIDGVIGSFLLSNSGGLEATDLPAIFDAAAFAAAGPRIVRLSELGGSYGEETRFFVIRFAEYKLYVRAMQGGLLGVLLTPAASMPALRAATGIVARRAETLLAIDELRGADTVPAAPGFDTERPSYPDQNDMPATELPSRLPGALGAPPSLTNTMPSIGVPEKAKPPPLPPPLPPSKRAMKYRGRSF